MKTTGWRMLTVGAVAGTLLVGCGGGSDSGTGGTTPESLDFAMLAGTWTGHWDNVTYASSGSAGLVLTVDETAHTAHAVMTLGGNVFGGSAPPAFGLDATYNANAMTFSTGPTALGNVQATITSGGVLTASITGIPGGRLSRVDVAGTVTGSAMQAAYTVTFLDNTTAMGTLTVAK